MNKMMLIKIDTEIHKEAKLAAVRCGSSLNDFVVNAIAATLERLARQEEEKLEKLDRETTAPNHRR